MGKKILLTIILSLAFIFPRTISAEKVAGISALLSDNQSANSQYNDLFTKKLAIKRVLDKWDSPLIGSLDSFMNTCIKYNFDCYLLPAISGVESSFGKFTYRNSNNPFGWGRGLISFTDWSDSIDTVGKGIRENYINKGADNIDKIGRIYCEGDTWSDKVKFFINQFSQEEAKIRLYSNENSVKL